MTSMTPHFALNLIAFIWFLGCWLGYSYISEHTRFKEYTILAALNGYRERWACAILNRDNRVPDMALVRGLLQSHSFFASTTIFILAGLVAVIGAQERVFSVMRTLPWAEKASTDLVMAKVGLLVSIFVYAFFKNTWSIRQLMHCAIVLAGVPYRTHYDAFDINQAWRVAEISSLAARHFTQMLRAYYFALAALAWFISPLLFILASTAIVGVLYARDYRSSLVYVLGDPKSEKFVFSFPGVNSLDRNAFFAQKDRQTRRKSTISDTPATPSGGAHSSGDDV